MAFTVIDMENWERKEHYQYYINLVKAKYTVTAEIDVTKLVSEIKHKNLKFYPTFLYAIIYNINQNKEFRMAYNEAGELGYWDICHPSYTIFHNDDKTFSDIWSEYHCSFPIFYNNVIKDMKQYQNIKGIKTRPRTGQNYCPISCVPWLSFTSISYDTFTENKMLLPIIVFGKYHKHHNKITLPFSIFVNHAVADGYHTCKLIQDIQYFINHLDWLYID